MNNPRNLRNKFRKSKENEKEAKYLKLTYIKCTIKMGLINRPEFHSPHQFKSMTLGKLRNLSDFIFLAVKWR